MLAPSSLSLDACGRKKIKYLSCVRAQFKFFYFKFPCCHLICTDLVLLISLGGSYVIKSKLALLLKFRIGWFWEIALLLFCNLLRAFNENLRAFYTEEHPRAFGLQTISSRKSFHCFQLKNQDFLITSTFIYQTCIYQTFHWNKPLVHLTLQELASEVDTFGQWLLGASPC